VEATTTLKSPGKPDMPMLRTAKFDVKLPTSIGGDPITLSTVFGAVRLMEKESSAGALETWASLARTLPDGSIDYGFEVTRPFTGPGTFIFVQTVYAEQAGRRSDTGSVEFDIDAGLDVIVPNPTLTDIPGVRLFMSPAELYVEGTTAEPRLWNRYDLVTASADFRTVLMFKPDIAGSEFVPIREVTWSFGVVAEWNGPAYYDWTIVSDLSIAPSEGATTTHPEWNKKAIVP
jgi:hypothetical protein